MNEDYVSFELAKKLKEKGFSCTTETIYFEDGGIGVYTGHDKTLGSDLFPRPYISQVLKWLREKQIMVEIPISLMDNGNWAYSFRIQTEGYYESSIISDYKSWEEAALICIKYILDNLIEYES